MLCVSLSTWRGQVVYYLARQCCYLQWPSARLAAATYQEHAADPQSICADCDTVQSLAQLWYRRQCTVQAAPDLIDIMWRGTFQALVTALPSEC